MPAEYTYFALFVLITAVALLTLLRMFRAAKGTIRQLNYESRRDKLQYERIAREKHRQTRALRSGARRINGKKRQVGWDEADRRAKRNYHVDEAAHEVFDQVSEVRGMDVRTPWGWPGSNGRNSSVSRRRPQARTGFGAAVADFFRTKRVVDQEVRAQRELAIRALVEDRYGRVGHPSPGGEIEWSRPQLPAEYLKERETDQMLAWKASQDVRERQIKGLRLIAGKPTGTDKKRKASGI